VLARGATRGVAHNRASRRRSPSASPRSNGTRGHLQQCDKNARGMNVTALFKRTLLASSPPQVEYALTDLGRLLSKTGIALGKWSVSNRRVTKRRGVRRAKKRHAAPLEGIVDRPKYSAAARRPISAYRCGGQRRIHRDWRTTLLVALFQYERDAPGPDPYGAARS